MLILGELDPQTEALFLINRRIGLNQLIKETRFTAQELKAMYRSFKIMSPSALIHRETFRNIFAEFFKRGDVEHYADLVFNAINTSQSGFITFPVSFIQICHYNVYLKEYALSLSILWRGTLVSFFRYRIKFNWYEIICRVPQKRDKKSRFLLITRILIK